VDRLQVERVAEDEGHALVGAQTGDPIPGEDALDAEERFRRGLHVATQQDLALGVQDAQMHGAGVKIDATEMLVGLGVESH
jgi:hypothetical protein